MIHDVAIIGAGAAGCFCAIEYKRLHPHADVCIYESGSRALAKVAITGGGRCNLTNTFAQVSDLRQVYPRGDKLMRKALSAFSHRDTWQWFEQAGVRLVAQDDECVFPQSQDAMQIVRTLLHLLHHHGVRLELHHRVESISPVSPPSSQGEKPQGSTTSPLGETGEELYQISFVQRPEVSPQPSVLARHVVVTTGGHPRPSGYDMLRHLNLDIIAPLPSLFTFNVAGDWHQQLMGTVVQQASVGICGTKFRTDGPLLLTHWGMSGPAILRLSSHAARHLAEHDYRVQISVHWLYPFAESDVRDLLAQLRADNSQRLVTSAYPQQLTSRHWQVLCQRASIPADQRWGALNAKQVNRLTTVLTADTYDVTGRCHFKEEFVTCGGVSLKSINPKTLESRHHPGLYFAGEVLDVDAVTGGFNLQAAWSTAYVVAHNL